MKEGLLTTPILHGPAGAGASQDGGAVRCLIAALLFSLPATAGAQSQVIADNITALQTSTVYRTLAVLAEPTTVVSRVALSGTLANGLVGYWPFDESSGSTAYDHSSSSNHGTASSATRTEGASGGAFNFAGNGSVVVPDNSQLSFGTTMSLQVWLNLPFRSSSRDSFVLRGSPQSGFFNLFTDPSDTGIHFQPDASSGYPSPHAVSGTIITGVWTHVVAVCDGSSVKLYLNKDEVDSEAFTGTIDDIPGNLQIGTSYEGGVYGRMDEVALWNRALTSAEVTTLFNAFGSIEPNTNVLLTASGTNIMLNGRTLIKELVPQGDLDMGTFTTRP